MNIISCDNCGVVLDKSKLKFPLLFPNADNESDYIWSREYMDWVPCVPCPVCGEKIPEREV